MGTYKKYRIRQFSSKYGKQRAKMRNNQEKELQLQLQLEQELELQQELELEQEPELEEKALDNWNRNWNWNWNTGTGKTGLELQSLEEKRDEAVKQEKKIALVKTKLDEIADHKTKGLILRPQARWHEKGEKSTKYFLQLESRNIVKKTIKKLKREDDSFTTDRKEILQMQSDF